MVVKVDADGCPSTFVVYSPLFTGEDRAEGFQGEERRCGACRGIDLAAFPSSGDMGLEGLGIDPYFFSVVRAWELNSPLVDAMGADTTAADFRLDHRAFEG